MDESRLHRAEFLIRWFLSVFNGRKAPFPRYAFHGIASLMQDFLAKVPRKFPEWKQPTPAMQLQALKGALEGEMSNWLDGIYDFNTYLGKLQARTLELQALKPHLEAEQWLLDD
jgi:hypothetical protein